MKDLPIAFVALVPLLFLPAWAFGQQNYQPAKIITLTGDTLRGSINYQGWDRNPKLITFRTDEQAVPNIFRPIDVKEFRVGNERYVSARVDIEDSPQDIGRLTTSAAPVLRPDTVFLKALVVGPRSLYRYNTGGREYFYTEQDGKFPLLVYKNFRETGSNGGGIIQANNLYRNQLALYLVACPTVEKHLRLLRYTRSDLQRLFTAYYACLNQQPAFLNSKKFVYQAGVLAGPSHVTLSFDPSPHPLAPTLDKYTSSGVTGGVFFYFALPGSLGHWSVNNKLTYNPFRLNAVNESEVYSFHTITNFSFAISYLKLNTLLRFTRPVSSTAALFVNAGISNGYAFQAKTEKTVTTQFPSGDRVATEEAFRAPRRYEQGLVAGIGGSYKKLSAEARYERSNGFLDITGLSSSLTRYSLLVGYRLR